MQKRLFDANQYQIACQSPVGEAQWASLKTPKKWNPEENGDFQISVITTKEEAEPLMSLCTGLTEKMIDMCTKDGKSINVSHNSPFKELDDGRIEIRFKKPFYPANDKYPATRPVMTYMPDGTQVDWNKTEWAVGNGSKVMVAAFARPYYMQGALGITMRLDKVKIHELEKYVAGGDGKDHEFSKPLTTEDAPVTSPDEVGQPSADF
tara:strand:- start:1255 stop:1875 length:621 start_codon:yes stop_codon:yes gene_type:complete